MSRALPSHIRQSSVAGALSAGQSSMLQSRINEKKAELASLKELQALSGDLVEKMQALENKLSTLSNGTEAVAAVLSNWHNVLRAINMASTKIPKPKDENGDDIEPSRSEKDVPLPQTLVRIPTQQAGNVPPGSAGE